MVCSHTDGGRIPANKRSALLSRYWLAQGYDHGYPVGRDDTALGSAEPGSRGGSSCSLRRSVAGAHLTMASRTAPKDLSLVRVLLALALFGVAVFIVWFVLN